MKLLLSSAFLLGAIAACGDKDSKVSHEANRQDAANNSAEVQAEVPLPSPTFGLSEAEQTGLRLFTTDAGHKGGLVLFDASQAVIATGEEFPQTAESAKVCIEREESVDLSHAQAFKSCCDKKGTAELRWENAEEAHCWRLSPVQANNANFRLRFTFSDGDSVLYRNPRKKS